MSNEIKTSYRGVEITYDEETNYWHGKVNGCNYYNGQLADLKRYLDCILEPAPAPPAQKTLGQVAHDAAYSIWPDINARWDNCTEQSRKAWQAAAEAVLSEAIRQGVI